MADSLDLTGDIAAAVNGAAERGHTIVVGYVDDDGFPITSFRGSVHVHGPDQLAIWARKADEGLARSIVDRPQVTLLYYDRGGPGPFYLSFLGRAHVDPSANDSVYENMPEGERERDRDRNGVAVIVDVDFVRGADSDGAIDQARG